MAAILRASAPIGSRLRRWSASSRWRNSSAAQDAAERAAHDGAADRAAHRAADRLADVGGDPAGNAIGDGACDLAGHRLPRLQTRAAGPVGAEDAADQPAEAAEPSAAGRRFTLRRA